MVIPLNSTHLKPAALMMARAFFKDPYYLYTIPDTERRQRLLPWLFEHLLRYGLLYKQVYTTQSMEGAALWLGPEKTEFTWADAVRSGLFLLPLKMSRAEHRRIDRLDNAVDRLHARAVTDPHWYLVVLGVDPACQGRGLGGALLQPVLELADLDHLPCFLDTNNEKNLAFYEKHGFKVSGQERPDPAGPFVWGMRRD